MRKYKLSPMLVDVKPGDLFSYEPTESNIRELEKLLNIKDGEFKILLTPDEDIELISPKRTYRLRPGDLFQFCGMNQIPTKYISSFDGDNLLIFLLLKEDFMLHFVFTDDSLYSSIFHKIFEKIDEIDKAAS